MLMWRPAEDTRLRLSWGRYFQAQGINELQVSDGEQRYSQAQQATHLVASIEHDLTPALKLRAEAYRKDYDHPLPRYELMMNTLIVLPELKPDRILIAPDSAQAEGAEISLNYDAGALSGWFSFSWSQVDDRVDGEWLPQALGPAPLRQRRPELARRQVGSIDCRHLAHGLADDRASNWRRSSHSRWSTVGKRNALHLSDFTQHRLAHRTALRPRVGGRADSLRSK